MKAEMGCMRKALINTGISVDKSPTAQKPKEQFVNGNQKNKSFAGAAKKSKANKIAQRSLVPAEKTELSDSDDDPQPEYGCHIGSMALVVKPKKKYVSPRLMNAMLVGITRRNS